MHSVPKSRVRSISAWHLVSYDPPETSGFTIKKYYLWVSWETSRMNGSVHLYTQDVPSPSLWLSAGPHFTFWELKLAIGRGNPIHLQSPKIWWLIVTCMVLPQVLSRPYHRVAIFGLNLSHWHDKCRSHFVRVAQAGGRGKTIHRWQITLSSGLQESILHHGWTHLRK